MVKIPEKLYVRLYAGMGDFYKRYFCHPTWQCLEDLKKQHPKTKIKALLVSQTIPALELVDYHPHIDKIIRPKIHLREFKNEDITKYMGDSRFLTPQIASNFVCKIPPIYLSPKDKEFIEHITSKYNNFICLHPFAGDAYGLNTRTPLRIEQYIPIIKALIKLGYTVFMLGKSWDRIMRGSTRTRKVVERFHWAYPGFVNLINQTNVRTGAELVRRSKGFVGTASSLMCAAWSMNETRTVIITPQRWEKPLLEMPWAKARINDPKHKMLYLNNDRSIQKLKEIANTVAKWF